VREHCHHYEVPLHSFTEEQLIGFGCSPCIDLRPKSFQRVSIRPKESFSLRENQEDAWDALRKAKKGILNLGCGRGKTVLGWLKASHEQAPTLIVSPQKAHLENWLIELEQFFDFSGTVGWVQSKKFQFDADICLATVQTLARRAEEGRLPREFLTRFGLVIYDECHCMAAEVFSKAADVGSGVRIGLSATPNRTDRCEGIFLSHLGPVFHSDIRQDLSPTFYVIDTGLFIRDSEYRRMVDKGGQVNVGLIRKELARNPDRNALIRQVIDSCMSEGRTLYVLSHSVDHVKLLHSVYPDSSLIHGGVKSDSRLEQLHGSDLVFATIGVGKEAYNRKDLDTLLLLTPFAARSHSAITLQQSVGRIQRSHPGKKDPRVFLFLDSNIDLCRGMIFSLIKEAKRGGYEVKRDWRPGI
jgi:superfamily II DNA or RNA helicase